ncbi:MAG: 50S ribosomal protein L21 [Candidatus Methylomirabilales bacterium]
MYAVIRTGGKQYKVSEGEVLEIDHLGAREAKVTFTPILVVTDEGRTVYGARDLKAYAVHAKVLGDAKGDKLTVFKYRPKSGYAAKRGHRQLYSLIEITSIGAASGGQEEQTGPGEPGPEVSPSEALPPTEPAAEEEASAES